METLKGKLAKKNYRNFLIILALIAVFVFGFWVRAYKLPTILNTECWDVTNAIRMHYLSFLNLGDTIRFNFWKSLFMGTHGIADCLYWYLVTGVYNLLNIPISEHYIYLAQVVLGMFFIVFMSFLSYQMFGRRLNLALFTMVFGVLNLDHIVAMSRTHWYSNSILLLEIATYAAVFLRNYSKKRIVWDISLGGLMFLNAVTPNIVIVPMVLLLQYLLYLEKNKTPWLNSIAGFTKILLNFREVLIWVPYFFGLVIDYFAQRTIGVSGLGLFGQITSHYGFNPSVNILKGLSAVKVQFKQTPDYFYNIMWIFSVTGGAFCIGWRKLNNLGKRYLFFIVLFLYHFGMEIFFGRFYLYDIFIPTVILGGVGLYYILNTINGISLNNRLLRRSVYYPLITIILVCILIVSADRINLAGRRDKGLNLIPFVPSFNETSFDTVYNRVNPLKTVGYYLRKKASKTDKIYTLFGGDAWTGNTEYYFGKKAMMTESGTNKQIFNNAHSLEFYKKRDGVDIFDYYVVIESFSYGDYYRNILTEAQKKELRRSQMLPMEARFMLRFIHLRMHPMKY